MKGPDQKKKSYHRQWWLLQQQRYIRILVLSPLSFYNISTSLLTFETQAYVRSMEDTRHTSIPFSQPAHRVRYYTYMAKLHEIKNESIEKYHGIMEFLFRAARSVRKSFSTFCCDDLTLRLYSAPQPTTWRFIAARQWLSRREVNTHGIQRLASGRQVSSQIILPFASDDLTIENTAGVCLPHGESSRRGNDYRNGGLTW